MNILRLFIINLIIVTDLILGNETDKFPVNFKFGAATSAFQIEGGWNEDGKGPQFWDDLIHKYPELIVDGSNADIGPDSYHLYKEDVKALKEIGMNFYRLSISWSRVLQNGIPNEVGIDYYNRLIDELLENQIQPIITIFHWDLPMEVHKNGGFTNSSITQYFYDYANLLFSRYGDRVKYWITFNQPITMCIEGYTNNLFNYRPAVEYLCGYNLLRAHSTIYHLYKNHYFNKQNGKIGIALSTRYFYAKTDVNRKWIEDRALQYNFGWFAHPIYSETGDYPSIMIDEIGKNSLDEGQSVTRLYEFDEITKNLLKGSADFIGLNYYTSRYVEYGLDNQNQNNITWNKDSNMKLSVDVNWTQAASPWIYSVPKGLRDLLKWIKDEYNNTEILITENGWSDHGELNDIGRINYIGSHLNEILEAINVDNCNIIGYTVWSIIDNFEWLAGYTEKFGLYHINMSSPMKERTPKKSAEFLRDIIRTRKIPDFL